VLYDPVRLNPVGEHTRKEALVKLEKSNYCFPLESYSGLKGQKGDGAATPTQEGNDEFAQSI